MARREVLTAGLVALLLVALIALIAMFLVDDDERDSAQTAPPTIDAVTGRLLGYDIGAPLDDVIAALSAEHGAPDQDFGWASECGELDPDGPLVSRSITYGDLRLQFTRVNGPEVLDSWQYLPTFGATEEPEVVGYEAVHLPAGVAWFEPLDAVALTLGSSVTVDDFGRKFVTTAGADFESAEAGEDPRFDALFGGDVVVCD